MSSNFNSLNVLNLVTHYLIMTKKVHEVISGDMVILGNSIAKVNKIFKTVNKDVDNIYRIYYTLKYTILSNSTDMQEIPNNTTSLVAYTDILYV